MIWHLIKSLPNTRDHFQIIAIAFIIESWFLVWSVTSKVGWIPTKVAKLRWKNIDGYALLDETWVCVVYFSLKCCLLRSTNLFATSCHFNMERIWKRKTIFWKMYPFERRGSCLVSSILFTNSSVEIVGKEGNTEQKLLKRMEGIVCYEWVFIFVCLDMEPPTGFFWQVGPLVLKYSDPSDSHEVFVDRDVYFHLGVPATLHLLCEKIFIEFVVSHQILSFCNEVHRNKCYCCTGICR